MQNSATMSLFRCHAKYHLDFNSHFFPLNVAEPVSLDYIPLFVSEKNSREKVTGFILDFSRFLQSIIGRLFCLFKYLAKV